MGRPSHSKVALAPPTSGQGGDSASTEHPAQGLEETRSQMGGHWHEKLLHRDGPKEQSVQPFCGFHNDALRPICSVAIC